MPVLTKSARQSIVSLALRQAFEDRFLAVAAKGKAALEVLVATEHPEWVAARADKDHPLRKYLAASTEYAYVQTSGGCARMRVPAFVAPVPCYGSRILPDKSRYLAGTAPTEVARPAYTNTAHVVPDEVAAEYTTLWDAYNEAWTLLDSTLSSYRTVEAAIKEFPEYAEFVPPAMKSPAKLPAVIPGIVRSKLTQLGVPAQGE